MKRGNIGCGIIRPDGWYSFDLNQEGTMTWDIRRTLPMYQRFFDYVVANHVLSVFTYEELPDALANIRAVLKPGGTFRAMVSDITSGFHAYAAGDLGWFPYDHRMDDIDVRFCTWLTWFGTHRTVFTRGYLEQALDDAGFADIRFVEFKETTTDLEGICDLDDRERESMFVEATA